MGIFFGGSGHGSESSCQISAYYKFFLGKSYFFRTTYLVSMSQIYHFKSVQNKSSPFICSAKNYANALSVVTNSKESSMLLVTVSQLLQNQVIKKYGKICKCLISARWKKCCGCALKKILRKHKRHWIQNSTKSLHGSPPQDLRMKRVKKMLWLRAEKDFAQTQKTQGSKQHRVTAVQQNSKGVF